MEKLDYMVETTKSLDEVVAELRPKAKENSFRVLHIHDVKATLATKGFEIEPMKIIEVCNALYASEVLAKDKKILLMLPCPISVFVEAGKTYISAIKPRVIADYYPDANVESIAAEVERIVLDLVDETK